jgi:hypothetical protein
MFGPQDDYVIKSIRADQFDFFREFVFVCTRTPLQQHKFPLRVGEKKAYTVDGLGVHKRSEKQPQYSREQKLLFSKAMPTSLVTSKVTPPVFGFLREGTARLIGVMFSSDSVLFTRRFFLYDCGTVGRPYDFETIEEAEKYFKASSNITLFDNIDSFKQKLTQVSTTERYNEVLTRVRWKTDGSARLFIATDNLESRLLSQDRARILYTRLKEQALELGLSWDETYQVPICFYAPGTPNHLTMYDETAQALDRQQANAIFLDSSLRKAKEDEKNFEFLLAVDDPRSQYTDEEWKKLIDLLCSQSRYCHIGWSLLEKMPFYHEELGYKGVLHELMVEIGAEERWRCVNLILSGYAEHRFRLVIRDLLQQPHIPLKVLELRAEIRKAVYNQDICSLKPLLTYHSDVVDMEMACMLLKPAGISYGGQWEVVELFITQMPSKLDESTISMLLSNSAESRQWSIVQRLLNFSEANKPSIDAITMALSYSAYAHQLANVHFISNPHDKFSDIEWKLIILKLCCDEKFCEIGMSLLQKTPFFITDPYYRKIIKQMKRKGNLCERRSIIMDLLLIGPITNEQLTLRINQRTLTRETMKAGDSQLLQNQLATLGDVIDQPFVLELLHQSVNDKHWSLALILIKLYIEKGYQNSIPEMLGEILDAFVENAQWNIILPLFLSMDESVCLAELIPREVFSSIGTRLLEKAGKAGQLQIVQLMTKKSGVNKASFASISNALESAFSNSHWEVVLHLFKLLTEDDIEEAKLKSSVLFRVASSLNLTVLAQLLALIPKEKRFFMIQASHYNLLEKFCPSFSLTLDTQEVQDKRVDIIKSILYSLSESERCTLLLADFDLKSVNEFERERFRSAVDSAYPCTLLARAKKNPRIAAACLESLPTDEHTKELILKKVSIYGLTELFKDYLVGGDQRLLAADAFIRLKMIKDEAIWHEKLRKFVVVATASSERPQNKGFFDFFSSQPSIPGHPLTPKELGFVARVILLQTDYSFVDNHYIEMDPIFGDLYNKINKMGKYGAKLSALNLVKGQIVVELAGQLKGMLKEASKIEKTPDSLETFKKDFHKILHSKDTEMQAHRKIWKPITANILIALTGIGLLAIIVKAASHAIDFSKKNQPTSFNNSFFFAKTSSQELGDEIDGSLNHLI